MRYGPHIVLSLALTLLAGVATADDQAGGSAIGPERYNERFLGLAMDADLAGLLEYVQNRVRMSYKDRLLDTPGAHERDSINAEIDVRIQTVKDSQVEFKGQQTGYNVSVVAGEFAHNTTESMLVAPVGRDHDYFFFIGGKFWKLVTTDTSKTTFPAFLVNMTQKFGAPASVEYRQPKTKTQPFKAGWANPLMMMEAEERPDYGAITIRWTHRAVADKLAELRGESKPPADTVGEGLDPTILDIMKDD